MAEQIPMTADGYQRLEESLARERDRREAAIEQIAALRDEESNLEDRNLELAQIDLQTMEARVLELEDVLARAVIVEAPEGEERVQLGSVVMLADEEHGRELRVQLVSAVEIDATADGPTQVSDDSPVGQAIKGRQAGDSVDVELADRTTRYVIRSIGAR
ncbi:GreA/GreB family elongation factor [Deinococcus taeanensis]|uniref:GreA/GreB family elongation factor n=1 Tax=Deinococcus taeanensis TaxID=2737050 RepID=UPI001CDCEE7E|nr:GreA/GreB family elongation factor [Deinococcus taeanensis]UBV43576.1 GreA/GreB family elongation factor [Deinococcus taeanensis]